MDVVDAEQVYVQDGFPIAVVQAGYVGGQLQEWAINDVQDLALIASRQEYIAWLDFLPRYDAYLAGGEDQAGGLPLFLFQCFYA